MTHQSTGAPEQLDRVDFLVGDWDVQVTTYPTDSTSTVTTGVASVTYANRGHAVMERFFAAEANGQGAATTTMSLLAFASGPGRWNMGLVDGYAESVAVFDGDFENDDLVLHNAVRVGGSVLVTQYRRTIRSTGRHSYESILETSTDYGNVWRPTETKRYTRRTSPASELAAAENYGQASQDRPQEAGQFDFLIGEWTSTHQLTFPNGQTVNWTANSTAVHVMQGRAIMEFNWFDTDPGLPDAATTIIRMYNRAARRWECLYVTNRFNAMLYFGGRQEGDNIVLHLFDVNTGAPAMSRFVFHDISEDHYGWFAETSRDRGETFVKTWIINISRNRDDM